MTLNLNRALSGLKKQQLFIPVLRAALANPKFKRFTVDVEGWEESTRGWDGYFHPSTHGNWTARQLAYLLKHGAEIPPEPPALEFVMAVTQGKFWHRIIQHIGLQEGLLRPQPGTTAADDIETRVEVPLRDEHHNLIGHADGEMATADDELFELKTMNDMKIRKYTSEDVLRELNPFGYWEQTQDYLMVSGKAKSRYVIVSMASPFPMQEFIVHADPEFQAGQRAKYREAITAAQEGWLPEPCCVLGSARASSCPVREFCPMGGIAR
jgi:hypothetical protein